MKKIVFLSLAIVFITVFLLRSETREVETEQFKKSYNLISKPSNIITDQSSSIPAGSKDIKGTDIGSRVTNDENVSIETIENSDRKATDKRKKFLMLGEEQVDLVLAEAKKLETLDKEVLFPPGCYRGEYFPYTGRPDRFEAELFISVQGRLSFDAPKWKVSEMTKFTVRHLNNERFSVGVESFKIQKEKKEDENLGFFILVENNFLYQIFRNEVALEVHYFEKEHEGWVKRTEFNMSFFSGLECGMTTSL
jgi:hypothetical protein